MQQSIKQMAHRRVQVLFERAAVVSGGNPELGSRYVGTARKIAMAAKIRLPVEFRRRTCKRCNRVFVFGENCQVRVRQNREPHVVVTCLNCGNQTRYLLRKKRRRMRLEQENNYEDEASREARVEG